MHILACRSLRDPVQRRLEPSRRHLRVFGVAHCRPPAYIPALTESGQSLERQADISAQRWISCGRHPRPGGCAHGTGTWATGDVAVRARGSTVCRLRLVARRHRVRGPRTSCRSGQRDPRLRRCIRPGLGGTSDRAAHACAEPGCTRLERRRRNRRITWRRGFNHASTSARYG